MLVLRDAGVFGSPYFAGLPWPEDVKAYSESVNLKTLYMCASVRVPGSDSYHGFFALH
jgi:hypothetical protein